ncbi:DUF1659 domain-containing protein [Selenomonas ruminantium]|uniref:DUF1659 domain-containing protein n=1 Tax=Selenomonas ruminantium TaxID=971 RepID=UPI00115FD085|nr:hypothetical protein [Selenomonas ruminantium]
MQNRRLGGFLGSSKSAAGEWFKSLHWMARFIADFNRGRAICAVRYYPEIADDDLLSIGKKLSNLQSFPVDGIGRVDSCLLAQEG